MHQGILAINKPRGKSSFYLVAYLRRLFKERTIGHAGTLDPFATGVMVMMIGREYTKRSDQFLGQEKEYLATILLGQATDTFDCDGKITHQCASIPSLFEIKQALLHFQGTVMQIPPMFSAKKIGGKKLYELARQNKVIERAPVPVTMVTELLDYSYPLLSLRVTCSKGTYIRSIADDLGRKLGSFGHLISLTRTRSGSFYLHHCLDLESFALQGASPDLFSQDNDGNILVPENLLCKPTPHSPPLCPMILA